MTVKAKRKALPKGRLLSLGILHPMSPAAAAFRAVSRVADKEGSLWSDLDWKLAKPRGSSKTAAKGLGSRKYLKDTKPPLRLGTPSFPGTLWTLLALLCPSQMPSSDPEAWATLGSEHYRPRAFTHPTAILPPPYEHAAFLYMHLNRFPPAARALGVHEILSDKDLSRIYRFRYATHLAKHMPLGRLLTLSIEVFVPPARWPQPLLETILRHRTVTPYAPSPQRVADVLLMGRPLAPAPVPRVRGEATIADVVEPNAYLLLILLGLTPEQMAQTLPLPAARMAQLASQALSRAMTSSSLFWIWFSGVDTRRLPCASIIPEEVHRALEVDAYPPNWTRAISHVLRYHIDTALRDGVAQPRPIPSPSERVPAGHTWDSLHQALTDPTNYILPHYERKTREQRLRAVGARADLDHYPPDPEKTYGRVIVRHAARGKLYKMSRPESLRLLEELAQGIRRARQ